MRPVSGLEGVRERIAAWGRAREIQQWKRTLDRLGHAAAGPVAAAQGQYDLRLVIEPEAARLQVQRPGAKDFQSLEHRQFNRLWSQHEQGQLELAPGAELLWQLLCGGPYGQAMMEVYYERYTLVSRAILGRILRAPVLESRIVTPAGQPLARPSEPLRWELLPAAGEQDDYRLRLVQANGAPAPRFFCSLQGRPALYLAADAVFKGPPPLDAQLDVRKEIQIPALAVESPPGVVFLQALGLELPPRLRERVRALPFEVAIHCELQPRHPSASKENCVLRVVAQAPDGHKEVFNGRQWIDSTERGALKGDRHDSVITVYDRAALQAVPALLEPLSARLEAYTSALILRVTRRFPEQFAAWLKTVPAPVRVVLEGELASFGSAAVAGRVRLDVREAEIDWFDLRVVLDVSDTTLNAEEIKLLLNAKGRYVRLEGKGWRRLRFDLTPEEDERLAGLGLNPREMSAEPQRLHALQLADDAAGKFLSQEQFEQVRRRASELKSRVAPSLPAGVTAELRPYQVEGFHFLAYLAANSFGGILADDMGLGKTRPGPGMAGLAARAVAGSPQGRKRPARRRREPLAQPGGLSQKRDGQLAGRGGPLHAGPAREGLARRRTLQPLPPAWARPTSTSSTTPNSGPLGETLVPISWLAIILDEGQYIKNPGSQTARVARALRARRRLVLSGTPIENRLLDLWSLMAFAMPGLLGNRVQFARLYDAKDDPFARRRLSARVRPFLLRRTKSPSRQRPPRPHRGRPVLRNRSGAEDPLPRRAQTRAAIAPVAQDAEGTGRTAIQFPDLAAASAANLLPSAPAGPGLKGAQRQNRGAPRATRTAHGRGPQRSWSSPNSSPCWTCSSPSSRAAAGPSFTSRAKPKTAANWSTAFKLPKAPPSSSSPSKPGAFGLNLTAASYVVLFDPWWNPAVENQAIDRTHRIGQARNVIAYRLLIKDSIEEKIRHLQQKKKALADEVLGEERFAQSLTLEDLRFLFAD